MGNFTKGIIRWGLFPICITGAIGTAFILSDWQLLNEGTVLGINVAVLITVALFERIQPFHASWNRSLGDGRADVQSLVLVAVGLEMVMASLTPAAIARLLEYLPMESATVWPGQWSMAAQLMLFVLASEFVKYWMHRLGHETEFGWRWHVCHHSVKRVYWLNGFRIHPLYHFVSYSIAVFPCLLLGAGTQVTFLYSVVLGSAAVFQHANIDLRLGVLNKIFNTNDVHRWHHSPDLAEGNKNYGAILIVWDLLFGTYYNPPGRPAVIGMQGEGIYPMNSYWKQIVAAFTKHPFGKADDIDTQKNIKEQQSGEYNEELRNQPADPAVIGR